MALQTRAIKRRIKSVRNTRKITKAMELIAASKMRKAAAAVLGPRPYVQLAQQTVQALAQRLDVSHHPLLRRAEEGRRVLLVLFTSDRGLAGGYNANVIRAALAHAAKQPSGVTVEAIAVGRRGGEALHRAGIKVMALHTEMSDNPTFAETLPIGQLLVEEFSRGGYDRVVLAYTNYVSAVTQTPLVEELLPFAQPAASAAGDRAALGTEPLFEPSMGGVLDRLLPHIVEASVYQAILEAAASEHASRMMAMRSASDAAIDMIDSLTLSFNQARQAGITQEIAEISGGKAALETRSD